MKLVFANSAFVDAPERFVLRGGRWRRVALAVRYGVLVHPTAGPVLIDTGYGPEVTGGKRSLALRAYNLVFGPRLLPEGAPEAVLRGMGFAPQDVRLIVLSHFHADHVSALRRFPKARVVARRDAFDLIRQRSVLGNLRHGLFAELLPGDLGSRMTDVSGLPQVEAPFGLGTGADILGDGSLLAIDLPGHAEGHFGLCFAQFPTPLLYAVDVQWMLPAVLEGRLPGFPASLIGEGAARVAESARRVAAFDAAGGQVMLCHDPSPAPYDLGQVGG